MKWVSVASQISPCFNGFRAKFGLVDGNYLHNEKELLVRLAAGDGQAFEAIYQLYSARLLGNLIKMVKSDVLAAEILQDVFIKIWDNRGRIDPEKSFRSWLFKIAENTVYDFFRKAARDKSIRESLMQTASDYYLHVEETLVNKENIRLLQNAIEALPPQRRQIFNLCRIEGKSYEEAGRVLGVSTSTISDHIVKANRFISRYLGRNQLAVGIVSLILRIHS